jgi:magnesium-protoporphyrin IX monomethyl ester (oxidative) cyclase
MNVLLLHLPLARRSYLSRFAMPEPLAHLFLAPVLARDHALRFVDLRIAPDLERELGDFTPDAAVVGVNPLYLSAADRALAKLRELHPQIKILLCAEAEYGNSHVAERPLDLAHSMANALVEPYFLAPLRNVVRATLAAWESGHSLSEVPGLWHQVSPGRWARTGHVENRVGNIGIPDRTLLGRARGRYRFGGISRIAHLFYTYGCKYKCRFCPMSKHDGSIVARSMDDVVGELEAMTEPHVYLQDYEPFLAPEAMVALADEVEKRGIKKRWYMMTRADTAISQADLLRRWKSLGLRWLYLGLDGSSSERLKEIRKSSTIEANELALRQTLGMGLSVSVGFVVRSDFTRDDFRQLRAYVRRLAAPLVSFTVETPLVGTRLLDESAERLTTRDWSLYDLEHAVLPTRMPLGDFYGELARLHLSAGMRTVPAMLKHFPPRDVAHIWANGWSALNDVRRAARDHERPNGSTVQPHRHSTPTPTPAHP